jgi:hypothetical protein
MYCPKCRAEYREGFSKCSDCNVDLVSELPEEQEPEYIEYEDVLSTYNLADIAIIKSLLEAEGITYYFADENVFSYIPALALPARLMVRNDQAAEAKAILKDADLSYIAANIDEPDSGDEDR